MMPNYPAAVESAFARLKGQRDTLTAAAYGSRVNLARALGVIGPGPVSALGLYVDSETRAPLTALDKIMSDEELNSALTGAESHVCAAARDHQEHLRAVEQADRELASAVSELMAEEQTAKEGPEEAMRHFRELRRERHGA